MSAVARDVHLDIPWGKDYLDEMDKSRKDKTISRNYSHVFTVHGKETGFNLKTNKDDIKDCWDLVGFSFDLYATVGPVMPVWMLLDKNSLFTKLMHSVFSGSSDEITIYELAHSSSGEKSTYARTNIYTFKGCKIMRGIMSSFSVIPFCFSYSSVQINNVVLDSFGKDNANTEKGNFVIYHNNSDGACDVK